MWHTIGSLYAKALGTLRSAWRSLTAADIAYKVIAFAGLMPLTTGVLYLLRAGTSHRVAADVDIALFFFTTPAGIATLILGTSFFVAITMIETACLMGIGLCASRGVTLDAPSALRFAALHASNVLRLTGHMVIRVLAGLIPFGLAGGAIYFVLLREHDINYYLAEHPWQFWAAAILVGALAVLLVVILLRTIARWALAMPLVVFENASPRYALAESAKRTVGSHALILTTLAIWFGIAVTLLVAFAWIVESIGLSVAPKLAGSIVALLVLVAGLTLVGLLLTIAVGIVNVSLFSLLITQLYLELAGTGAATTIPQPLSVNIWRLSSREKAWATMTGVFAALGFGLFAFLTNSGERPAYVIAHRGSSAVAPENTLAAFNLAARQQTDYVELDVQESADGQVIVAHDSDLMKVGGSPLKVWDADAATLRSIDIGSFKDPSFAGERVPTLAEALAACKGRCHVIVELKSYGHSQNLEERVAAIVEEAGMANDCVFMSLDHAMVGKMKTLRPGWRVGLLVAKAIGDLTELQADFLAVEARMATRSFIRRAHRAGQDVYIWTVNDPAWMFLGLSRGVDGLITDKPDVARNVIEMRARMTETQRFLVAVLIRLGASTEMLEAENALRP